jgi:uncharacterized membrane protein
MAVVAPCALADGAVSDAEALAIVRKHCVMCHAVKPTYAASQEAPNNVMLETIADFKKYRKLSTRRPCRTRRCRSAIRLA